MRVLEIEGNESESCTMNIAPCARLHLTALSTSCSKSSCLVLLCSKMVALYDCSLALVFIAKCTNSHGVLSISTNTIEVHNLSHSFSRTFVIVWFSSNATPLRFHEKPGTNTIHTYIYVHNFKANTTHRNEICKEKSTKMKRGAKL